ncbi:cytochrome P450 81Q32-like isoform X2 [Daucus carota subsp. sativus]|uniref:cytochrome P450 81Q32-like isoform X2 n=1 Tax=Daucus carota subsp. sativus TaxID=79200 RepID=UPI0030836C4C
MEANLQLLLYASLPLLFIVLAARSHFKSKTYRLPPSPKPKFPLLGHLYLLKGKPLLHRTFHDLSKNLGPIFSLHFGSRLVVVVSSPSAAEECFTKNDIILANRPRLIMGKHMGYNYTTMVQSPYGDHWRNLRKLATLEIFSTNRLNTFLPIRRDEVNQLLRRLSKNSQNEFARVEIKSYLKELSFNIITRMIGGEKYFCEDVDNQAEIRYSREILLKVLSQGGVSHAADFVPLLRWIDYDGYEKGVEALSKKKDKILEDIIDKHRRGQSKNSMVDHLLSLQKSDPDYYSDTIIKGLMTVMILAGTDTSVVTIEWAMSLLLNNPYALRKARDEIDSVLGLDHLVDESDLSKLPYLENIISETFRLYPASPLLVPHESSADCKIEGYDVPRGTILLVNAWSIHRDEKVWDDPLSFKPERFESGISAEPYKLMPFGMGRRSCPGSGLAQRVVGLALASLIQCFEWKRISEEEVDLAEGRGLTMPKLEPLEAMCRSRDIINKVLA